GPDPHRARRRRTAVDGAPEDGVDRSGHRRGLRARHAGRPARGHRHRLDHGSALGRALGVVVHGQPGRRRARLGLADPAAHRGVLPRPLGAAPPAHAGGRDAGRFGRLVARAVGRLGARHERGARGDVGHHPEPRDPRDPRLRRQSPAAGEL
ncbi:MAG: hypothetical protein AVDCRST_MAG54-4233, partial [uncultured Actinomycetospora sp.]